MRFNRGDHLSEQRRDVRAFERVVGSPRVAAKIFFLLNECHIHAEPGKAQGARHAGRPSAYDEYAAAELFLAVLSGERLACLSDAGAYESSRLVRGRLRVGGVNIGALFADIGMGKQAGARRDDLRPISQGLA